MKKTETEHLIRLRALITQAETLHLSAELLRAELDARLRQATRESALVERRAKKRTAKARAPKKR